MTQQCKVLLDCVEPSDAKFQRFLSVNDITMKVVNEHGPAGGNPEVEFVGTNDALTKMIEEQFDDGGGDMSYLTDLIEPL